MHTNNTYSGENWPILRLIALYRIFLGLIFIALYLSNLKPIFVDQHFFYLFSIISIGYTIAGVFIFFLWFVRYPSFFSQTFWQLILDIAYINSMVFSTGQTSSAIVILLVIPVMISAYTLPKIYSLLIAAFASLFLIAFTYLNFGINTNTSDIFFQHGVIGVLLFSLVLVYTRVAQKTRKTQKIAKKQAKALENLELINQQVMNSLTSGILIVDKRNQVKYSNYSANDYIGTISKLDSKLYTEFENWLNKKYHYSVIYQASTHKPKLRVTFKPFVNDWVMIVLDKVSAINDELQQLKLSSLGRLTASMAHEIRNPLSSINQAAQLLKESSNITPNENKLTAIITNNVDRMNLMVDRIMQLSKKENFEPENINLNKFLELFIYEFSMTENINEKQFEVNVRKTPTLLFDNTQLNQIFWNLCSNTIKHSQLPLEQIRIKISCQSEGDLISIIYEDNGIGIQSDMLNSLFEPFFTSSNEGTGLGLYICKELCHINQADIVYIKGSDNTKFKITGITNESTYN